MMLFLWALGVASLPRVAVALSLQGRTNDPETSTFVSGEKVKITFDITGATPGTNEVAVDVRIADEHDQTISGSKLQVRISADGKGNVEMDAPSERLGFYRVYASTSDGTLLEAAGSRRAGFLTYAILPDPSARKDYGPEKSRFGMQGSFGPWNMRIKRLLGIRWVLADDPFFGWRNQEPNHAGEFDPDALIAKEKNRTKPTDWRTFPVPTIMSAPKWPVKPETLLGYTGTLTEEGEKAWVEYCRKISRAFAAIYPDIPHIYQITWEPVQPWGFKGTADDLARIYELAYPALHEGDPKAIVAGPTGAHMDNDEVLRTDTLLQKGLAKNLDAYTNHPYTSFTPEADGLVDCIRRMKATLRQRIGRDIPMMGTEQSNRTEEDPKVDLPQARALIRENLIMLGEGFEFNFGFYITDYHWGDERGFGYYYNLDEKVPFGPKKISPKPVAAAYAAQSLLIDGSDSLGAIEWLGETTLGYIFARGDEVAIALWDYGNAPRSIELPTGCESVRVYDWMGNHHQVSSPEGRVSLTVGLEPIYVTGVSPKMWGKEARSRLVLDGASRRAYPGGELVLRCRLSSDLGSGRTLKLSAELPKSLQNAPFTQEIQTIASAETPLEVRIPIPRTAIPGRYPLNLTIADSTDTVASGGAAIEIVAPVTVTSLQPAVDNDGKVAIKLIIHNEMPRDVHGTMKLSAAELPELQLQADFELPASAAKNVILSVPASAKLDPLSIYTITASVSVDSGVSYPQEKKLNFWSAAYLTKSPKMDGSLADWSDAIPVPVAGAPRVIRGDQYFKGDTDLSGVVRIGWNEEALFLRVDVTDDVFSQTNSHSNLWLGDCLQLGFNLDPFLQHKDTGNVQADKTSQLRFSEINVARTAKGPVAYRGLAFDQMKLPAGTLPEGAWKMNIDAQDGSIVYELSIPWATLGATQSPEVGQAIGMGMAINDSDGEKRKELVGLGVFGGIHPVKAPSKFGCILLGPKR
jgi:hypothetical protein